MTRNVNMTALMALVVTLVAAACGGHSGWLSGEQVGGSRNAASTEAGAGSGTGAGSGPVTFGNGSGSQTFGGAGNSGASASSGSGATGGCDASCFTAGGTCASNVCTITENPGNVVAPMQTTLQHTGTATLASFGSIRTTRWSFRTGISTITTAKDSTFTYMGLFPDGTFGMSATSYHFATTTASKLYSTKTAANIPAPGWDGVITLGGTPAFSPDGKQIAFMHEDKDAHTISKMDFDVSTKTFSGLVDLASEPSGHVAWPAFTPDGKSVLFQSGSSAYFDTDCQNTGDLYSVDIATHTMRRLDVLDGYTGSGTASYLPAMDPGLNYAPTLLAEAVGGYFWTVFTSHRSYGSMLASKANSVGTVVSGCPSMPNEANGKLWVAAIDIDGKPGQDASHPAFYLDGQELEADNLRGYWVLPACQANATSCQTGDECCCGFCRSPATGSPPVCLCKPKGCSNEFETCTTAADCCMSSDQCINGRCATSIR